MVDQEYTNTPTHKRWNRFTPLQPLLVFNSRHTLTLRCFYNNLHFSTVGQRPDHQCRQPHQRAERFHGRFRR